MRLPESRKFNRESFLANYGKEGNSRNFSSADDSHYTVDLQAFFVTTAALLCQRVVVNKRI